jgi:hypothetical protein
MKPNVGAVDRVARLAIGATLVLWAIIATQFWLALVGGLLIVTGLISFCPLYQLVGIRTCPNDG